MDFGFWIFLYIFINGLLAMLVSFVAGSKGRSETGFFLLSFFFSFLVGILVALALPSLKTNSVIASESGAFGRKDSERLFKCPACAEWVKAEAKICRFCNRDISEDIARSLPSELQAEEATQSLAAEKLVKLNKSAARQLISSLIFLPVVIYLLFFYNWD